MRRSIVVAWRLCDVCFGRAKIAVEDSGAFSPATPSLFALVQFLAWLRHVLARLKAFHAGWGVSINLIPALRMFKSPLWRLE